MASRLTGIKRSASRIAVGAVAFGLAAGGLTGISSAAASPPVSASEDRIGWGENPMFINEQRLENGFSVQLVNHYDGYTILEAADIKTMAPDGGETNCRYDYKSGMRVDGENIYFLNFTGLQPGESCTAVVGMTWQFPATADSYASSHYSCCSTITMAAQEEWTPVYVGKYTPLPGNNGFSAPITNWDPQYADKYKVQAVDIETRKRQLGTSTLSQVTTRIDKVNQRVVIEGMDPNIEGDRTEWFVYADDDDGTVFIPWNDRSLRLIGYNLLPAVNPTLSTPTSTSNGFTTQINNFDPSNFQYSATVSGSGGSATVNQQTGLVTVSGITAGSSSTVTVTTASDYYKPGTSSVTGSATASTVTVPSAPSGVQVTPGDQQFTATWTKPTGEVTGYRVEWKRSTDSTWQTETVAATATTFTKSGLVNGTDYQFRMLATNTAGSSAYTTTATVKPVAPTGGGGGGGETTPPGGGGGGGGTTPPGGGGGGGGTTPPGGGGGGGGTTPTPPASPTGLQVVPGDGQVALSWSAPTGDITGYKIEAKAAGSDWTTLAANVAATSYVATGLTNGVAYTFQVSAISSSGTSTPALSSTVTPIAAIDPIDRVTPPLKPSIEVGGRTATISWVMPEQDSDVVVQGYRVEYVTNVDDTNWVAVGGDLIAEPTLTLENLATGTYYFRIVPVTNLGDGKPSEASDMVRVTATTYKVTAKSVRNKKNPQMIRFTAAVPEWAGKRVRAMVKVPGKPGYVATGKSIRVNANGKIAWSIKSSKRISVFLVAANGDRTVRFVAPVLKAR